VPGAKLCTRYEQEIFSRRAELAGFTVLHLDKDFDLIAEITGQPMERLNVPLPAVIDNDEGQTEA
jgi:hypothetical protein